MDRALSDFPEDGGRNVGLKTCEDAKKELERIFLDAPATIKDMQYQLAMRLKATETGSRERAAVAVKSPRSTNTLDHPVVQFQRIVGNQAMQGLLRSGKLQTKVKISQASDVSEQEAD